MSRQADDRLSAHPSTPVRPDLTAPHRSEIHDGVLLEWSDLSRALDATDDVMMSRGHRLSSYSNEEYAAVLRAALRAEVEPPARLCGCMVDADLNAGSTCSACGHRDHGRSGCRASAEVRPPEPETDR